MEKKDVEQFNKMLLALRTIWKGYMSPSQLRKKASKEYGLDYAETLEMAYENIQETARQGATGVRVIKPKGPTDAG